MRRTISMAAAMMLAMATLATAAEPVVVLPLGDSITAGSEGGYRKPLVEKLASAGLKVTTVGSVVDASLPAGQQAHEGHPGWRLTQLAEHLPEWIANGGTPMRPTVVTLMAGINDLNGMIEDPAGRAMSERSDEILSTLQTRLKRVVAILDEKTPDAAILLGGCTPYANGMLKETQTGATDENRERWARADGVAPAQEMGVNHWVIAFNRWVRDVYVPELQKAGKKVAFADVYAPFILPDGSVRRWSNDEPEKTHGPAAFADYGLHPNTFGYGLIADAWASAIEKLAAK